MIFFFGQTEIHKIQWISVSFEVKYHIRLSSNLDMIKRCENPTLWTNVKSKNKIGKTRARQISKILMARPYWNSKIYCTFSQKSILNFVPTRPWPLCLKIDTRTYWLRQFHGSCQRTLLGIALSQSYARKRVLARKFGVRTIRQENLAGSGQSGQIRALFRMAIQFRFRPNKKQSWQSGSIPAWIPNPVAHAMLNASYMLDRATKFDSQI